MLIFVSEKNRPLLLAKGVCSLNRFSRYTFVTFSRGLLIERALGHVVIALPP